MNQQKQINNAMEVLRRAEKYLDIANNLYAIAYEETFLGGPDDKVMYAANRAVIDCIETLSSLTKEN